MKMKLHCLVATGFALIAAAAPAPAQEWPSKPVKLIVGFAPGGPVDTTARVIADKLSLALKQPVVVDNKPGANGVIGSALLAKSAPDGYTLMMGASTMTIQVNLIKNLPFDVDKDIEKIAIIGQAPMVLLVSSQSKVNTVADLVALGKSNPGRLSYANPSHGSSTHLAAELFKQRSGTDFLNVLYKGGAQAETDLLGGHVTMMFAGTSSLAHVRGGRMRALAVTTAQRSRSAPEIPTLAESGFPGFDVSTWYGIMGPAGMPKELVTRINAEVNKILAMPDVQEQLKKSAVEPSPWTPAQFATFMQNDQVNWAKVIKDAKIPAE